MSNLKEVFQSLRAANLKVSVDYAFEAVKSRLVADPILDCSDFTKTFVLQTDASDCGLDAILSLIKTSE